MIANWSAKLLRKFLVSKHCQNARTFSTDVVVIGGGAMGSSVAYWLREKTVGKDVKVVVIEKDSTYANCSTCLSVGGIRHQFSLPENIQMSVFGSEFLINLKKRFGSDADISFTPNGYLLLASQNGAEQLAASFELQQKLGASNYLLTKNQLKERFKWMNVDDVELGCLGGPREGWFDPWRYLSILKNGAINEGAQFVQGEVINFTFDSNETLHGLVYRSPNGAEQTLHFKYCVVAAGANSGDLVKLAKVGLGKDLLSVPLPVEKRKRYVYRFGCQGEEPPEATSPLVIDYTGAYFRRDGPDAYIGGISPKPEEEPDTENLDVDFQFFDDRVWPLLAARVPPFESIKIKSGWAGFYEYNTFDENGIIGPHPHYQNLYFATGFSGHGIQQSSAVGLAIAELILDGKFQTIDLSRLGFGRLITNKPLYETGIF